MSVATRGVGRAWLRAARCALLCTSLGVAVSCRSAPRTAPPSPSPEAAPAAPLPVPPATARLEPLALPLPSPAPPTLRQLFRAGIDSMVNDAEFRNAHWGILIVDAERGDTLYQHNADKLFMPASNQKIVTGAVALTQLGPDYRWHTVVELRGTTAGGTFTGDVIVHGRGDPSWSDAMRNGDATSALAPVADALAARGITRIAGRIVEEGNAFSDEPSGFGWAFDDFDFGYSAPVDELLLNEGSFVLTVHAGQKAGQPLVATTRPTRTYPRVTMRAVARAQGEAPGATRELEATWDSTATAIEVTGTLPPGDSAKFELAYRHSNDAVMAALRELLGARGIAFAAPRNTTKPSTTRTPASGAIVSMRVPDTLVVLTSPPLRDVLKRLEKPSQNQMAEALYKTLALEKTGVGRADSARGVIQRQLVDWGIPPEGLAVRDGSGLSRHDYVAPRTLVAVLDVMRKSPVFDAFYAALPVAGVDGTLAGRMKGTAAANNVHAKTGTVDKARSLSGYVTTADGHLVIFSALCNNFTVPTRAVERVQDEIAVRLATMRLRDPQTGGR